MIVVPTIRLATANDAAAIAHLSRDEIEHGLGWSWTPGRIRRALSDTATNVAVAEDAGEILGFGIMVYSDEKAHLSLLAVHPACRQLGLGGRLLDWLERCAVMAGIARVELEARADNPGALAFYGLRGYSRFATVHGYYQGRVDAYRLVKRLTG